MLDWNWIDDTRAHDLHERADLVDIRTWQTLKRTSRIAVADGTEKVRLDLAAREEFSIDSGELTPTLKVKRNVIDERYGKLIDELYGAA